MKISVSGIGIWAHGIANWEAFQDWRQSPDTLSLPAEATAPSADIIPPREKRRVPLITRMAIEAGIQACRMAAIDPGQATTVFSSCMGDTDVTDYMCRVLATPEKAMSPTKFHNSVHNATSGYWSIFTGGHHSGGFVGAYLQSFATALIEAATLTLSENKPTLLVMYDIANRNPMHDACPIDTPLAYALLLHAADDTAAGRDISLTVVAGREDEKLKPADTTKLHFEQPGDLNPAADGLALLAALGDSGSQQLQFAAGGGSVLDISVTAGAVPSA